MSDAPDLIAPIIGYRQWRVAPNAVGEPELSSGGIGDAAWTPGTNRAECKLTQLAPTLPRQQSPRVASERMRLRAPIGMRTHERTYGPIEGEEELSGESVSQLSVFLAVMGLIGFFTLFALIASIL